MKKYFVILFFLGILFLLNNCGGDISYTPEDDSTKDCGNTTHDSWYDKDKDGISDNTEINNRDEGYHPDFEPDSTCNDDPSVAEGDYCSGTLTGGLNLKDNALGYIHFAGCDAEIEVDRDDWGTLKLINCIEIIGRAWGKSKPAVNITDLSLRYGDLWSDKYTPAGKLCEGHGCHQNGLEVDVRYVRNDGENSPLNIATQDTLYDVEGTSDLLNLFNLNCSVNKIYVNDYYLQFSTPFTEHKDGHSDHFHVKLNQ